MSFRLFTVALWAGVASLVGWSPCLWAQATAPEPLDKQLWIKAEIMPKFNAQVRNGTQVLDTSNWTLPFTVCDLRDQSLCVKKTGDRWEAWIDRSEVLAPQEAIGYYTAMIDRGENLAWAFNMRGISNREFKHYLLAINDFNIAAKLDPRNENIYMRRGLTKKRMGDVSGAIADYDLALQINPNKSILYQLRGVSWYSQKDYNRALADFTEAIRLDPVDDGAFMGRVATYHAIKNFDAALKDLDYLIKNDANDTGYYYMRAAMWTEKGEHDRAIADYDIAIKLEPQNSDFYVFRAFAWHKKNDQMRALADLDNALKLNWRNTEAYHLRIIIRCISSDLPGAIDDCSKLIEINPLDSKAYSDRGAALTKNKMYFRAVSDLNEAIRLDPTLADAYEHLAHIYSTCPEPAVRDAEKAVAYATKGCNLTQWKDADQISTLAGAYSEAGNFDEAQKWQQQAIQLSKGSADSIERAKAKLAQYQRHIPLHVQLAAAIETSQSTK